MNGPTSSGPTTPGSPQTPAALRGQNVRRTLLILVGIVLVLGGALYWMDWRAKRVSGRKTERARAHVILRPGDEAQDWRMKEGVRIEEMTKTIDQQRQQLQELRQQLDQFRTDQRREREATRGKGRAAGEAPPVPPMAAAPLDQILPLPSSPASQPSVQVKPAPEGRTIVQSAKTSKPPPATEEAPVEPEVPRITVPARPKAAPTPPVAKAATPSTPAPSPTAGRLRVITPRVERRAPGREGPTVGWLPSGSFIHSMLLSGVDAGTGTGSNLPYPVLLRMTDPGILPNRFKMDLAECFVIGAAFGDLPSERVYIRSETLSCLRRSGGIITIDGELKAHAIGEDGKVGLRGRVVSKEGTLIARSLMAGFLSGLGQAFRPRITYAPLQLGGDLTGNQAFSLPPIGDTLQAAGVSGVGRSMELLSQYYLKQAQGLYPIIEINAGREVDLMVLKGLPLKFNIQRAALTDAPRQEIIE